MALRPAPPLAKMVNFYTATYEYTQVQEHHKRTADGENDEDMLYNTVSSHILTSPFSRLGALICFQIESLRYFLCKPPDLTVLNVPVSTLHCLTQTSLKRAGPRW